MAKNSAMTCGLWWTSAPTWVFRSTVTHGSRRPTVVSECPADFASNIATQFHFDNTVKRCSVHTAVQHNTIQSENAVEETCANRWSQNGVEETLELTTLINTVNLHRAHCLHGVILRVPRQLWSINCITCGTLRRWPGEHFYES